MVVWTDGGKEKPDEEASDGTRESIWVLPYPESAIDKSISWATWFWLWLLAGVAKGWSRGRAAMVCVQLGDVCRRFLMGWRKRKRKYEQKVRYKIFIIFCHQTATATVLSMILFVVNKLLCMQLYTVTMHFLDHSTSTHKE